MVQLLPGFTLEQVPTSAVLVTLLGAALHAHGVGAVEKRARSYTADVGITVFWQLSVDVSKGRGVKVCGLRVALDRFGSVVYMRAVARRSCMPHTTASWQCRMCVEHLTNPAFALLLTLLGAALHVHAARGGVEKCEGEVVHSRCGHSIMVGRCLLMHRQLLVMLSRGRGMMLSGVQVALEGFSDL